MVTVRTKAIISVKFGLKQNNHCIEIMMSEKDYFNINN